MKKINIIIKKSINGYKKFRYHQGYKKNVMMILKNVEAIKGRTDPNLFRLADEYAEDILGWKGYSPWLYVYCAVAGTFKEGWIPDNYYARVVVPMVKGDYRKIASFKALNGKLFPKNHFPDIAYYTNGTWFSKNYEILDESIIKNYLFQDSDPVVFKIDSSLQGQGVFFIEKTTFNLKQIEKLGNGVFQKYIKQHSFFNEFTSNSVATIRITTVIDKESKPSVRASYIRLGRDSDTHVKSATHIRVPINLSTGNLENTGFLPDWRLIDSYPVSNLPFKNKIVPNFDKCISTAIQQHEQLPFLKCIGWDMIVDDEAKVKIMEWNGGHNDIKFSEATQGPCFSDLDWEILWRNVKRD